MARLQILELPEGSDDERPPFVLVIDEWDIESLDTHDVLTGYWDAFGQKIGARGVLFVDRTIDIPANDTTAYLQQVAEETGATIGKMTSAFTAQQLAHERTEISRDMDRLAHRREQLADALGLSPNRSWDDIRDTAARLRAEAERLRAGEEPYSDEGVAPTPAQWIWQWNQAAPEKRLNMAAQILNGMPRANRCFMADHEATIEALRAEVERLRTAGTDDA